MLLLIKVAYGRGLRFGKILFTFSMEIFLFSMSLMKVEVDGLKQALWRKSTVPAMVPAGMMLLMCSEVLQVIIWSSLSLTCHRPVRGS